jgi:hypothetical protein
MRMHRRWCRALNPAPALVKSTEFRGICTCIHRFNRSNVSLTDDPVGNRELVAGLNGDTADDASRRPQKPYRPEDRIAGEGRRLVAGSAEELSRRCKPRARRAGVSGGATDGGAGILIGGSADDARSGQNRRCITSLARGKRAGASRNDGNWTARRAEQPAQAGSNPSDVLKNQASVRIEASQPEEPEETVCGASRGQVGRGNWRDRASDERQRPAASEG